MSLEISHFDQTLYYIADRGPCSLNKSSSKTVLHVIHCWSHLHRDFTEELPKKVENSKRFMYFFSIFDFYSDKEESSANNIVQKSVANVLYCSIWRAVSAIMFRLRNMLY